MKDIIYIAAILIVGYFIIKTLGNASQIISNKIPQIPSFDFSSMLGDTVSPNGLNDLGNDAPTYGPSINAFKNDPDLLN